MMEPYYEIQRKDISGTRGLTQLKLVSTLGSGREVAAIYVERGEGTVFQLQYPSTKTYGGPETAQAIAKLMLTAAEVAWEGTL